METIISMNSQRINSPRHKCRYALGKGIDEACPRELSTAVDKQ